MQHVVRDSAQNWSWLKERWLKLSDTNTGVIQSVPGYFKIAHLILGFICLVLTFYSCQLFNPMSGVSVGFLCSNSATFFLLVTYGCFVTSLLLFCSFLFSYFTASFLPKTVFEFTYHGASSLMYFIASLVLLITTIMNNMDVANYKEPGYAAKITAAVFGLINAVLYGFSTFYSMQSRRELEQSS